MARTQIRSTRRRRTSSWAVTPIAGVSSTLDLGGSALGNSVSGAITNGSSGTTSVIANGTGLWTLSGSNTFSGGLTVSQGTVNANVSNAIDGLGSGSVSVNSGAVLNLMDITTASASVQTLGNNSFSGSGTLKLTFNNTNSTLFYLYGSKINSFAGTIELALGTAGAGTTLYPSGDGSTAIQAPNATLQIDAGTAYEARNTNNFARVNVSGSGIAGGNAAIYFHGGNTDNFGTTPIYLLGNTTFNADVSGQICAGTILSGASGTQTLQTLAAARATWRRLG